MKKLLLALGVLFAMLLSSLGGALAATQFSDVPSDHRFYEDIAWMAETGISEGYDDGTFKPDNPVARQAMAAFMHRFAETFQRVNTEAFIPEGSSNLVAVASCPDGGRAVLGGPTGRPGNDPSTWERTDIPVGPGVEVTEEGIIVKFWLICFPKI